MSGRTSITRLADEGVKPTVRRIYVGVSDHKVGPAVRVIR